MQTPYVTYREAMGELSQIIRSQEPGYVRIRAICAVVSELSPSNSAQRENHLALGLEPHPEPEPRSNHEQPQFDPRDVQAYAEVAEIMRKLDEQVDRNTDDEEDDEEEEEPQ